VEQFRWNSLKYRTDLAVREIADVLLAEVTQIDTLIKGRMNGYYQDKAAIDAVLKAKSGNLMVRNLGDVLGKADIVNDSEYMETLLVVVPKYPEHRQCIPDELFRNLLHSWEESYEKLSQMVVPNSAKYMSHMHSHH
jgi:V-type H+-transporting ATPase subunit C